MKLPCRAAGPAGKVLGDQGGAAGAGGRRCNGGQLMPTWHSHARPATCHHNPRRAPARRPGARSAPWRQHPHLLPCLYPEQCYALPEAYKGDVETSKKGKAGICTCPAAVGVGRIGLSAHHRHGPPFGAPARHEVLDYINQLGASYEAQSMQKGKGSFLGGSTMLCCGQSLLGLGPTCLTPSPTRRRPDKNCESAWRLRAEERAPASGKACTVTKACLALARSAGEGERAADECQSSQTRRFPRGSRRRAAAKPSAPPPEPQAWKQGIPTRGQALETLNLCRKRSTPGGPCRRRPPCPVPSAHACGTLCSARTVWRQ